MCANHIINNSENNTTENSSFYGIITEDVLSSKKILPECKLLFVKLTMMVNSDTGYAFPSNKFLANYFNVDESTIKRWLKILKDNEFIYIILEKNGMKTKRKVYINMNSKNIPNQLINKLVDGSSIRPSTAYSCTPTNIRNTNIKNPPPPSSKPNPKEMIKKNQNFGKVSLRSEEEDFSANEKKKLVSSLPFTDKEKTRLMKIYSYDELKRAIEIFYTHDAKKDPFAMILHILNYPDNWEKKIKIKSKEEIDQEKEDYRKNNKSLAIKMADMYKNHIRVFQDSVRIVYWDEKHDIYYWDENFEKILHGHLNNLE